MVLKCQPGRVVPGTGDLRLPRKEAQAITSPSQTSRPALQCPTCPSSVLRRAIPFLKVALSPATPVQGSGSEKISGVMKQVPAGRRPE